MLNKQTSYFFLLLIFVLLVRLLTLPAYPLMDTTEARYSEIARIMYETEDWITPYFDYGTPFWGKPPLSFWLTAASFKIFGVSEFSARLPSWLCGVASLWLLSLAAKPMGIRHGLLPVLICASSIIFFICMGAVMTEASLLLGVVLSLVAASKTLFEEEERSGAWPYLFFVGLALGMLAKGPIAVVLTGTPILLWALIHGQVRAFYERFPWVTGVLLFLAISVPWYAAAEVKTPGFLDYFIVGEHFRRFLEPGWSGDLYGTAHNEAYGTIWRLWLLAACPWSFFAIGWFVKKNVLRLFKAKKQLVGFDLGWDKKDWFLLYSAMFPMVFFTFAGNILAAYVAPGIPAFALLMASAIEKFNPPARDHNQSTIDQTDEHKIMIPFCSLPSRRGVILASFFTPILMIILSVTITLNPNLAKTEKALIEEAARISGAPIYYLEKMEFSARFYSHGTAQIIQASDFKSTLQNGDFLVVSKKKKPTLQGIPFELNPIMANKRYTLYLVENLNR